MQQRLVGHELNGQLEKISPTFKRLATHLAGLDLGTRQTAWEGFLCGRADSDTLVGALATVDPEGPPPEADPPPRPANLADLRNVMSKEQWVWELYIPASRIAAIAAFEGVGKTRLAMDLARLVYFAKEWPDGRAATMPERTPTLWVCADGQQDDLAADAQAFGMPDDSIFFNTIPEDPYGGNELDDPESLARLEEFIKQVRPGLVFVDTLTNATSRDLCRANDVKDLVAPLRDIAQRTRTTIILLLHLAMDGQALGKRIKGITRTILLLERPDAAQPGRLRLSVQKSFGKTPPALGVTMTDSGNEYDLNPPNAPGRSKSGRPPEKRNKAEQFIRDALTRLNDQIGNELTAEWVETGGNCKTFWRAVEDMVKDGELVKEGGPGTGKQVVLHLNKGEPDSDIDLAL